MGVIHTVSDIFKIMIKSVFIFAVAFYNFEIALDFILQDMFAYNIEFKTTYQQQLSHPKQLILCNHVYKGVEGIIFLKYFLNTSGNFDVVLRDEFGSRIFIHLYNRHRKKHHLQPIIVHWTHEKNKNNNTVNKCVESLKNNHTVLIFLRKDKLNKTGVYNICKYSNAPATIMNIYKVDQANVWQIPFVNFSRGDQIVVDTKVWHYHCNQSVSLFNRHLFDLLIVEK